MLTDEQIKALLAGCEGVERGPWTHSWSEYLENAVRDPDGNCVACDMEKLDAAHIARCDPQTISELCTRVLEAEERAKVLKDALHGLLACPAIADGNHNEAAYYDAETVEAEREARKALEEGK